MRYKVRELPPPGGQITIEVRGRGGERMRIVGKLDATPEGYGNVATKLVVVDAVAMAIT